MMFTLMLMKLLILFKDVSCFINEDPQRIFKAGDVVIGGLFPIHSIANGTRLPKETCDRGNLDIRTLLCSQTMIYAIEQINNSSLLPNVRVGYEIYDTCSSVSMALRESLILMEEKSLDENRCVVFTPSDNVDNTVKAVIGELSSEVSVAVARLLAIPLMTQVSYASTSETLSSRSKFPSFFRTVPSDKHQTEAIAQLVHLFRFVPVGIIGSDDEYGNYGAESLSVVFTKYNICLEFKEILPADFSEKHSVLLELRTKLSSWRAEAIVLFTKASNAKIILEEAIKFNPQRTWIASDAWSTDKNILNLDYFSDSIRIFGITCRRKEVPGFSAYMENFIKQEIPKNASFFYNIFCENLFCTTQADYQNCSLLASNPVDTIDLPSCICKKCLIDFLNHDESYEAYAVYMAVNVIAHGLQSLLKNYNGTHFPPWMLKEEIQKVNFTLDNILNINLNEYGELDIGYDILKWNTGIPRNICTIGTYEKGSVFLNISLLDDNTVTPFNCSKSCGQEYELYEMNPKEMCCKGCRRCDANYFSIDGLKCKVCNGTNPQSKICTESKFLLWSNGFIITLVIFTTIGIIVTLIVSVLFTMNIHTPVVRAAGGFLCFPTLLSLLGCFISVFLFLGEPTDTKCRARQSLFNLCFTVCVSCILANLLQIFVGFTFTLRVGYWLKRINKPVVLVMVCASVQVFMCALWLVFDPPSSNITKDTYNCSEGSVWLFVIAQIYISLLCIVCFIFAYKGRLLPGLYKNARFVAIGMIFYLMLWLIFIPMYTQEQGVYEGAIKASAVLVSDLSVLVCHFAPKCYILVWKKELNNENIIAEQIRKHFEQKEIRVLS